MIERDMLSETLKLVRNKGLTTHRSLVWFEQKLNSYGPKSICFVGTVNRQNTKLP